MAEDTWNSRSLPTLEAVHAGEEAEERIGTQGVAEATRLPNGVAARTVAGLLEAHYLTGMDVSSKDGPFGAFIELRLLERGRRAIGVWPADAADGFLLAINRLIAAESDEESRGRLAKLRDAAGGVSKQILAGAIVAAGQAGLG